MSRHLHSNAAVLCALLCLCVTTACDDCEDPQGDDVRSGKDMFVGDSVADTADAVETDGGDAADVVERDWTLYGEVRLDEAVGEVGRGDLYVAILTDCGAWSTAVEMTVAVDVDLEAEPGRYGFELPSGTWHLSAFLDLDGDADASSPRPGTGDIALRNASDGTSCVHYELGGGRGTVENALVLDAVVP